MTAAAARTVGWPSAPKVLVHAVATRFGAHVATRFPGPGDPAGDVQAVVASGAGVVRIVRLGGSRDRVTDSARVSIDVVHATEAQAEDLAEEIAAWLVDDPAITDGESMLDRVTVEVAPHEVPYPDPTMAQFQAIYVASSRRLDG